MTACCTSCELNGLTNNPAACNSPTLRSEYLCTFERASEAQHPKPSKDASRKYGGNSTRASLARLHCSQSYTAECLPIFPTGLEYYISVRGNVFQSHDQMCLDWL